MTTVLLVNDEQRSLDHYSAELQRQGFTVYTTKTTKDLPTYLSTKTIDAIVCDTCFPNPEEDGDETCARLKEQGLLNGTTLIGMSALDIGYLWKGVADRFLCKDEIKNITVTIQETLAEQQSEKKLKL